MANFRNVQNDGRWHPGGTYTFEFWTDSGQTVGTFFNKRILMYPDPSIINAAAKISSLTVGQLLDLVNNPAINLWPEEILIVTNEQWPEGDTGWVTVTITVSETASNGDYDIAWLWMGFDETPYLYGSEVLTFSVSTIPPYLIPSPLVPDRPPDYDPNLGWDGANSVWIPTSRGGGRYRQQLIAIGKEGEIYFGNA